MPYKDRATRLAYAKSYRDGHSEQRARERPTSDRARHANQRAKRYGVSGRITSRDVRTVLTADARCFYCQRTREELPEIWGQRELGIDHRIPLHAGGPNTLANLVPCCHPCNASKFRGDKPYR